MKNEQFYLVSPCLKVRKKDKKYLEKQILMIIFKKKIIKNIFTKLLKITKICKISQKHV